MTAALPPVVPVPAPRPPGTPPLPQPPPDTQPRCTPDLAPLRGCLAPRAAYVRVEADARSQELSDNIDEIAWAEWIDGDHRMITTGDVDTCGCEIMHWRGADNDKSVTLHDGCDKGCGAHIWSGTMTAELDLDGDHFSRLQLAAALHEVTIKEAAAAVGVQLGGDHGEVDLAPVRPEQFEQAADEAERRGDCAAAEKNRHAAKVLAAHLPDDINAGEASLHSRVAGGVPTPPNITLHAVEGGGEGDSTAGAPRPPLSAVPPIGSVTGAALEAEPESGPTDPDAAVLAEAAEARLAEAAQLTLDLHHFLMRDPAGAEADLGALMAMTLADRAEVVEAARGGRLTRLGLTIRALAATATGSRQAWIRLREGAAGPWSVADLTAYTDAELDRLLGAEPPMPRLGNGLFYDRGIHVVAGPGGCGKTWLALEACVGVVPAVPHAGMGTLAVYLDLDQNLELIGRLRDLGLDRAAMKCRSIAAMNVGSMAAERREGTVATLRAIVAGLVEAPPRVVVVDSLTRVMAETGESSNDADSITRALNIFNNLAEKTCVIVLDHTGHQEPDRPSGSAAKINASRAVLTLKPTSSDSERFPNTLTAAEVVITKDRDGGLRRHTAQGDREPRPTAGLAVIDRDDATGRTEVKFIPQARIAAAQARRDTDTGHTFAADATAVIRRIVDAAARAAVTVERARERGVAPLPPLSATGAADAAWEHLRDDARGGRRSDVRAAVDGMCRAGELVEYIGAWGKGVSGTRLRVRGGITDGKLDPVD